VDYRAYDETPSLPERTIIMDRWNIEYWATKLQENEEKINPLLAKLNYSPITPLTYEELMSLRYSLQQNRSYITLLNEEVAKPDPKRHKIRFWKN
jgi:hypothetical protein